MLKPFHLHVTNLSQILKDTGNPIVQDAGNI